MHEIRLGRNEPDFSRMVFWELSVVIEFTKFAPREKDWISYVRFPVMCAQPIRKSTDSVNSKQ